MVFHSRMNYGTEDKEQLSGLGKEGVARASLKIEARMAFLTVDCDEDGGVAELFLCLQLVLDVGRDLDEVLLPDPLPVPDEDHTTIGRFHAVVVTAAAAAVDIEWGRCLVAAAAAGVIVEAAPDEVGRCPGARVVDRRAGQLRRE